MSNLPENNRKGPVRLSLVVPCYNESQVIEATHAEIMRALGNVPDLLLEVVYVDDGSRDDTRAKLRSFSRGDGRVKLVELTRNFGHQPAVSAGLQHATGDVVVIIDADLQDPPQVVLRMLERWRDGYDVVNGVRQKRKESLPKRLAYQSFYRFYRWAANVDVPLDAGDFSLMDRQVVDAINALPESNRFVRGLRSWVGFRQCGLEYERSARFAGETKYPLSKLVKLAFDGIFNFSTAPVTAILVLGAIVAGFSAVVIMFLLVQRIAGFSFMGHTLDELPGYTSTLLAVLFLGGCNWCPLGLSANMWGVFMRK